MGTTPNSPLHVQLPAIPVATPTARLHLRYWLQREHWPDQPSDDITYGVSEAIANAIQYAHAAGSSNGATVTVTAEVEPLPTGMRRIRVRVSDHGCGQPTSKIPERRRLGFPLMNGVMDQVQITQGDGVTTDTEIVLLTPPVPAVS